MRFRHVLLMLLVAALAVTAGAAAGDRPGKPEKKNRLDRSAPCRHKNVLLKGTFLSAGADSFTMNVLKGNRGSRKLRGEQTLLVGEKTKLRRKGKEGQAALSDLVKDDRLLVLAKCKRGEAAGSFTLRARFVQARTAKPTAT